MFPFLFFQIDWEGYFNAVFRGAEVFLNDDEKIIVREPEYFEALLPILADTPKAVLGEELVIPKKLHALSRAILSNTKFDEVA